MSQEFDIIGSGTVDDPYRPDIDKDYINSDYNHEAGIVTVDIVE